MLVEKLAMLLRTVTDSLAILAPNSDQLVPIGVFWDIENCSVPRGKSALSLVQRIRDEFFNNHKEVEFMCVCDIHKENKDVIHELILAQVVTVVIIQLIRVYVTNYPEMHPDAIFYFSAKRRVCPHFLPKVSTFK